MFKPILNAVGAATAAVVLSAGCVDNSTGGGNNNGNNPVVPPPSGTYTLTISATDGGTVSPAVGTHSYGAGASVTVTATADAGYTFGSWTGASSSTDAIVIITMDGDKMLTANFRQDVAPPPPDETFVDERDGKTYGKITIGAQTWMRENLNYSGSEKAGVCYGDSEDSCAKYGRLYRWHEALGLNSSTQIESGEVTEPRGICPSGWRVPRRSEWEALINYAGGEETAGAKLKSNTLWYDGDIYGLPVSGTDDYGFSALPGGYIDNDGELRDAGISGKWWSATTEPGSGLTGSAFSVSVNYNGSDVVVRTQRRFYRCSLRCVRD